MILLFILGLLTGVALTLGSALALLIHLLGLQGPSLPAVHHDTEPREQYSNPQIPKNRTQNESLSAALNGLMAFYFQEMKNSDTIRNWAEKKLKLEIESLNKISAIRAITKKLSLRDFDVGQSLPHVTVHSSTNTFNNENTVLEETEALLDIEYTGGAQMEMEISLSFDKNLIVMCKLVSLVGRARLKFSRLPFTHWSFSFKQEPIINVEIETNLDGRKIPQIVVPIIRNQIKRVIRRRHTLPNFRMRVRPFFGTAVYKTNNAVTGPLQTVNMLVTIVSCDRLMIDKENSESICCLLNTGARIYSPKPSKITDVITITVPQSLLRGNFSLSEKTIPSFHRSVICFLQTRNNLAFKILKGDVLEGIDGIPVTTVEQATSLLNDVNRQSIQLTIRRPRYTGLQPSASDPSLSTKVDSTDGSTTSKLNNRNDFVTIPPLSLTSTVDCTDILSQAKHRTMSVKSAHTPVFNERFGITFKENDLFLKLFLISKNILRDYSLIAYTSISINDAVAKCQTTMQGDTMMKVSLNPPPDLLYVNNLAPGARCLEPNRCFGDITVRFAMSDLRHTEEDNNLAPPTEQFVDIDIQSEEGMETDSNIYQKIHVFRETNFSFSIICDFCSKKIWMKKALYCDKCNMVCHKKCTAKSLMIGLCGGQEYKKLSERERDAPEKASITEGIMNRIRRRKINLGAVTNIDSTIAKDKLLRTDQFSELSPTDDISVLDFSSSDEDGVEFLFGQKDNDEEKILITAKQMGKELYTTLHPTERRIKLEEMIAKLHAEIEMVSKVRDDLEKYLKMKLDTAHRKQYEAKLTKTSEKIQSLAVLLLHYCAGLQDCEENSSVADTGLPTTRSADRQRLENPDLPASSNGTDSPDSRRHHLKLPLSGYLSDSKSVPGTPGSVEKRQVPRSPEVGSSDWHNLSL